MVSWCWAAISATATTAPATTAPPSACRSEKAPGIQRHRAGTPYINWVSAAEGEKFATVIKDFTETIRSLTAFEEVIMTDRLTALRDSR
jgi:hypothetical protein